MLLPQVLRLGAGSQRLQQPHAGLLRRPSTQPLLLAPAAAAWRLTTQARRGGSAGARGCEARGCTGKQHRVAFVIPSAAAAAASLLPGVVVVYVTAPSAEVGTSLARALVEAQLVACVNLLPGITSIYRWQVRVGRRACARAPA